MKGLLIKELLKKMEGLKLDNKKMLIAGVAGVLILYIDFTFVMKPQVKGIAALSPKITRMRKDVRGLAKDLARLEDMERMQDKVKTKTGLLKPKEIITEDKILLLLQDISDLANKHNVKITQISTSRDKKVQEEVIAGERFLPVIITLNLSCGYHALGSFMNDMENAGQFIEVQDMKIVRDPKNYLLGSANLSLKTYARK